MSKNNYALILLIAFMFSAFSTFAQQSPVAAGGDANSSSGSIAFSIGQVFYNQEGTSKGAVNQGLQQTYVIIPTSITENNTEITLAAYPNPTSDKLMVSIKGSNNPTCTYVLFDASGKIIDSKQFTGNSTTLSLARVAAGNYFLKITDSNNKEFKNFKIIKN